MGIAVCRTWFRHNHRVWRQMCPSDQCWLLILCWRVNNNSCFRSAKMTKCKSNLENWDLWLDIFQKIMKAVCWSNRRASPDPVNNTLRDSNHYNSFSCARGQSDWTFGLHLSLSSRGWPYNFHRSHKNLCVCQSKFWLILAAPVSEKIAEHVCPLV